MGINNRSKIIGGKSSSKLTFADKLQAATNEDKQVNELYKHELKKAFAKLKDEDYDVSLLTIDIDNPIYFKTDGIFPCTYYGDEESRHFYYPFFLLMECKLDKDFNIIENKAEVLTQVVAYLGQIYYAKFAPNSNQNKLAKEKFGLNNDILDRLDMMPSTAFVGSKTTCFAISVEKLKPYFLQADFDSIKSASTYKNTLQGGLVYRQILNDNLLDATSPVFNTSDKYCMTDVAETIYKYNKNIKDADDLSPRNLYRAFTRFTTRVLTSESAEMLTNRKQAELFAKFIVNRKAIKKETDLDGNVQSLTIDGTRVNVNEKEWITFSWMYNLKTYNDEDQKKITAITDQLLQEDDRRRKGDYYTPSIWVNEAHKLLDKNLGPNWREEYMVWDCAWGTGNLTRDCTKLNGTYIPDLYCSTLEETDLEIGARYNRNATKFQYDFLNDDVDLFELAQGYLWQPFNGTAFSHNPKIADKVNFKDILDLYSDAIVHNVTTEEQCKYAYAKAVNTIKSSKLYSCAPKLLDTLMDSDSQKPLLFFINPPYGTSGELKTVHNDSIKHKEGIGYSAINVLMTDEKIGTCSRQLVAQFMYRIDLIQKLFGNNIKLGMFSPTSVLTSNDYEGLLIKIDHHLGFTDGFMFCASEFADVKPNWGIMFSLYSTNNIEHNRKCSLRVLSRNPGFTAFNKTLYMIDKDNKASWWTKEPIKDCKKSKDTIYLKSALNVHDGNPHNQCIEGSIGGFISSANNVNENTQFVALLSCMSGAAKGLNLGKQNYDRVISLFTARRLISGSYANWANWQDEYMIPNINHPAYAQWQADCIVYSLFNAKSNQSSLRNIEYNGKTWNIQNEFFWMSVKDIAEMAKGETSQLDTNTDICDDIEQFGDNRFVYKKLQTVKLSPDAQAVLDKATELVRTSFKHRNEFNRSHPEYHINTWDAGWYQIKGLLNEYDPEGLKQFNALYKAFEDRMRPLVYELGFLYK